MSVGWVAGARCWTLKTDRSQKASNQAYLRTPLAVNLAVPKASETHSRWMGLPITVAEARSFLIRTGMCFGRDRADGAV